MSFKKMLIMLTAAAILLSCYVLPYSAAAEEEAGSQPVIAAGAVKPDTWTAVDGLGRTVNTYSDVGGQREGKFVGMFYWTWHYSNAGNKARNVSEIINAHPEARNDWDHEAWENTGHGTPYFWNEPVFGYYRNTDEYVVRKHAEMLADAGVDVIIFDCTNGTFTWKPGYDTIFEVFEQARAEGVDTPQVAFMLNFGANENTNTELKSLYRDIYKKERYKDLWFMWEGRPLIMAHPDGLDPYNETEKEILNFFTFRRNEPSYFAEDRTIEQGWWGWCSVYPQTKYGVRADGSVEQMTVNVAQNASEHGLVAMNDYRGGVFGRGYAKDAYSYSYTYQNQTVTVDQNTENAYFYGLNFQQQWDYALSVDPDFIFITGWNEWIAGRHSEWQGTTNAFPDQYNDEFSRDIEPSKGVLKDHFYYQLVSNIRRYKGVQVPEVASEDKNVHKTIDINSSEDQWADVRHEFNHYIGSTIERKSLGWGKLKYESNTMRNDIVTSKVAFDDDYIYFMAETLQDLTDSGDPAWMRLLIDTDFTGASENWEGFEYIINRVSPTGSEAVVEKADGKGWSFVQSGTARFSVQGNRLQLAVPREALGMSKGGEVPAFNFKWADNTRADGAAEDSGDILDFYQYGDVAPGGRFMFAFRTKLDPFKPQNGDEASGGIPWYVWMAGGVAVAAVAVVLGVLFAGKKKPEA